MIRVASFSGVRSQDEGGEATHASPLV